MRMRFTVITPFPEAFESYLGVSTLKRAIKKRLISVRFVNPRDFTKDKHRTLDDKPYGGGAGMVLMAEPILRAIERIKRIKKVEKTKIVILSAKGKQFNQKMAYDWAKKFERIILVSGRYEGIDERVKQILKVEEVSIGPYVLTDGDVAAMAIVSAVSRLVPGVIKLESLKEESHGGVNLEYPQYTRPEVLLYRRKKYWVPKILLSGNHGEIAAWRRKKQKTDS